MSATARPTPRLLDLATVRRLAISRQLLDGPAGAGRVAGKEKAGPAEVTEDDVVEVVRRLGYVQLDPISVVARSHLLVLFARLGRFDAGLVEEALFGSRRLFEGWSHQASIVPTEDYQLHRVRHHTVGWELRIGAWMAANSELRQEVLARFEGGGPLPARSFADVGPPAPEHDGWSSGRDVDRMLRLLWMEGALAVTGRTARGKSYQLTERWLPDGTPLEALAQPEIVRRQVERSLRALGAASARQITGHYNERRYPGVEAVLAAMVAAGELVPVEVAAENGSPLRGEWYLHVEDLPLVERIEADEWWGRAVLLSPFDNLIIDRTRTEQLFGFEYRMEIYVPRPARRYGYYVLPLLCGDRLVARADLRSDRRSKRLEMLSLHVEPGASRPAGGLPAVRGAFEELARSCALDGYVVAEGALEGVPAAWAGALRRGS